MRPARARSLRFRAALLIAAIAVAILAAASPWWVPALGAVLIDTDPLERSDAALVLGGDGYGRRILLAAELARKGVVPHVYVSGPGGFYGFTEDELAIEFITRKGYPREMFTGLRNQAKSTRDEAVILVPLLRQKGLRSVTIVTSDFHTRRAKRVFRELGPDIRFRAVASDNEHFRMADWWRHHEGREAVFMEWTKTLADWMGM